MKLKKIGFLFLALFFFSLVAIGLTTNQAVKADDDDEDYHASSEQLINKFFNERELLKNGARAEILDESQPGTWYEHTFIIYNDQYHDFDHMPYGTYTIANEMYVKNWKKPSDQNLRLTFYSTINNPRTDAAIRDNIQGSVDIPAGKDSGYSFWVIKVRCDKDGLKVLSHKDYDHDPASPYSVKQVKNIFLKNLTLKSAKKSAFVGNKPKFKFSNISFVNPNIINEARGTNWNRSMLSHKGKLPVHDYDFKAHVRVNNFKPSKRNRNYDLVDKDGDTIGEIHVPKNSKSGTGNIKLDLELTFDSYYFEAK